MAGIFDYYLSQLSPYQGGLLGVNDTAGIARQYGGYRTPWPTNEPDPLNGDQSGGAPMASRSYDPFDPVQARFSVTQSTEGAPNTEARPMIRPGSVFDSMMGGAQEPPGERWRGLSEEAKTWFRSPGQAQAAAGRQPIDPSNFSAVAEPQPMQPPIQQPPTDPAAYRQFQPADNAGQSTFEPPLNISPQAQQAQAQQVAPQMAAPPQAQAPQVPQGPGAGDRLSAAFHSWAQTPVGSPMAGLSNLISGATTGQLVGKPEQQANMRAMFVALQAQGMTPAKAASMAEIASRNPKLAEELFKPPANMEARFARDAGGGGTQPYFDYLAGKNEAEKAGTTAGERKANAAMDLPSAVAQAKDGLRLIQELRTHKGRDGIGWHGYASSYIPDTAIPGNTESRGALALLNQIKGGAFLEAFKSLKGAGQITEVEGKKATDAIARMERPLKRAEFDKALSDYEGVIKLGIDRANQQAGREAPGGFKGNSDWQQVRPGVRIRQVQ